MHSYISMVNLLSDMNITIVNDTYISLDFIQNQSYSVLSEEQGKQDGKLDTKETNTFIH